MVTKRDTDCFSLALSLTLSNRYLVPNYGTPGRGTRLCAGLVIAIEPMVNVGTETVRELSDGWTVKTADGALSAHYENTVALTSDGVINLTLIEQDF